MYQVAGKQRAHGHDRETFANGVRERLADQETSEASSGELLVDLGVEEDPLTVHLREVDEVRPADG